MIVVTRAVSRVTRASILSLVASVTVAASIVLTAQTPASQAPASLKTPTGLQTPEQFAGHRIGADNKLVRWDRIVEYMTLVSQIVRSRAAARAGQVHQRRPVHRARDQCARDAEESRSLQGARTEALFPGRRADRRRARRDLPRRQGGRARHLQHPRDRDRRVADGAGAGASPGDGRLAGRRARFSTTSSSSSSRA